LGTHGGRGVVRVGAAFYSDVAIKYGCWPGVPVQGSDVAGQAGSRRTGFVMSEPFRPYEKLVEITVFGKKFQVPERNSLLRCFQFISPETIPYGRFCWNQDCQYCRVTCQLPDEDEPHEMLSCKFIVMPGMEITEMSQELKWCLRAKLPSDTPVSS
jgi:hypothetical protein